MKNNSRPLLLGHRGARRVRRFGVPGSSLRIPPENTVAAFEYALANGCDGFEFDVRYSADRRSVLCHDPKLGRRVIATTDYSGLERRYGFERRRSPMACLEDVLSGFGDRAYLDIELKVPGNEETIVSQLKTHPPSRYVVSSFLPEVLLRLHELDATLPLGYICQDRQEARRWAELPIGVFLPHYTLVEQSLIEEVHDHRVQLFTWTVNDQAELLRLASWGVDGLISDDPKLLSRTFLESA